MIRVEKFIPGGQSLGVTESGKKIFFWNALPGEEVIEYQTLKTKSHYDEAIATKLNNVSSFRAEPKDSCFLSTSPWQNLAFNYELEQKQNLVVEIFREHQIDIKKPAIFTDQKDYYYRNKMEYSLYWDNQENIIKLSFYERSSHRKLPITKSSIERPEIFAAAKKIVDDLNVKHEESRKFQALLLRCNQKGEVSGGLFAKGRPHPKFNNLTDYILGQEYSYSPNGFFQINLPVYELALQEIKKHITTNKVLDLYAGVGTIGLSVARDHNLTLVECDKSAYDEMEKNCQKVSSGHTSQAILARSEEALNYIEPDQTVILDPPRAGCDAKLIHKLLETLPQKIIYLSCNPATQARDVKMLLQQYQIDDIKIFNFFPHTPHIENLVVLSKETH